MISVAFLLIFKCSIV